jgi:hypothetical protein
MVHWGTSIVAVLLIQQFYHCNAKKKKIYQYRDAYLRGFPRVQCSYMRGATTLLDEKTIQSMTSTMLIISTGYVRMVAVFAPFVFIH